MTPAMRKTMLTAHVVSSVGWLGAVAAFLVLSVAGLAAANPEIVRSCYLAMNVIGQFAIVPLSLLALLTGVAQALATPWGLFRYYWVVTKLALTIGATAPLLLHQFTAVAGAARRVSSAAGFPNVGRLGMQLVFDSGLAVVVLLVTTTLSVFKPWGRLRATVEVSDGAGSQRVLRAASAMPRGGKVFAIALGLFLLAIIVLHLTGHGMGGHGM